MSFDYGADVQQAADVFKLWPREGKFTALIDGDMIPYIVGYTTDLEDANRAYRAVSKLLPQLASEDFCHPLKFAALMQTPEFNNKMQHANFIVNDWVSKAEADSALIYLTTSTNNYRNAIAFSKPYKGQRNSEKPPFFYEIKHYIATHHEAIIADGMEADDLMSIEMWRRHRLCCGKEMQIGSEQHKVFSDCAIVSKDKDLRIVPGWNVGPDKGTKLWSDIMGEIIPVWKTKGVKLYEQWPTIKGEPVNPQLQHNAPYDTFASGKSKGEVKFKRVCTGVGEDQYVDKLKGSGLRFFYSQLVTGDQVDNYPGIPGMGAKAAYEVLATCETEEELYYKVLGMYKEKYGTESEVENYRGGTATLTPFQLMIEQGRLAHMQTVPGELWRAKNYCPSGESDIWTNKKDAPLQATRVHTKLPEMAQSSASPA